MFFFSLPRYALFTLILSTYLSGLVPAQANQNQDLDFSGLGRPGSQTSGENRGPCPDTPVALTALVPSSHSGKTEQERPTFWVYFPYPSSMIVKGEFSLQDEGRKDLYRADFLPPAEPGFVGVSLPPSAPPLEQGKSYRWYFKVYCRDEKPETLQKGKLPSPAYVQGWVERVQQTTPENKNYSIYTDSGLWYDAIAALADLRRQDPNNPQLAQDWRSLLQAKGVALDWLLQEGLERWSGETVFVNGQP